MMEEQMSQGILHFKGPTLASSLPIYYLLAARHSTLSVWRQKKKKSKQGISPCKQLSIQKQEPKDLNYRQLFQSLYPLTNRFRKRKGIEHR